MTSRTQKGLQRPDFGAHRLFSLHLSEVRLSAASVAEFSIGAHRGLAMQGPPYFFLVLEGQCWLHVAGDEPVCLEVGDSVLSLRGDLVRLSLARDVAAFDDIGEVWRASGSPPAGLRGYDMPLRLHCGERDAFCRVLGSALIFSRSTARSALIREAPPVLRLPAAETRLSYWAAAVSGLLRPADGNPKADDAIASTALSQFLLIEQLKAYLARDMADPARHAGRDRPGSIWNLIHMLQREPARSWSIAAMAREAAMSRTRFIETFGELTGTTPFRFLVACRMDHAAELLRASKAGIEEIAALSGYQSQRAFRSAFAATFGTTPRAFRAALRNAAEPSFTYPADAQPLSL